MQTPYFLIDEQALLSNLNKIDQLRKLSGAKVVLALKCFSTWGVFDVMRPFLDGTTSSSVYEAQLGYETFGGETHAYSVAFSPDEAHEVSQFSDKIIFNSLSQYEHCKSSLRAGISIGIRLNPEVSHASYALADPAAEYSRLGVKRADLTSDLLNAIEGCMFHVNCENRSLAEYKKILASISADFSVYLDKMKWVSLGGGVMFTDENYPLEAFAELLREFAAKHSVQVYLEPGEAVISHTADLVVSVADIVCNEKHIAIVDSSTEAHRLDTLIYSEPPQIRESAADGNHEYMIASNSCLAGDVFCTTQFDAPLTIGDKLHIMDSAGYTMVTMNWFNGLRMPSVYLKKSDGSIQMINKFEYADFKRHLSLP